MDTRVWFITGCSSGFGKALAEAVLESGDRLIGTARDVRSITDFDQFDRGRTCALDVTDPVSVAAARQFALEAWGRVDVLVNNAGYGLVGAVEECSEEQIRRCFETNFHGPLRVIREFLPALRAQGRGHIVNLSAAAAISNYAGFGAYGGAKAALELLSESLRAELAPFGIRVSLVQPGPFRTDFIARSLEKAEATIPGYERSSGKFGRFLETLSGRQPGDPAKAAQAILALVRADSPPMRLVLGKYAHEKVRRRCGELERERAAWESVGLPTDFPPA
ncbi:MAG: SDR family NAD(P)-dependent oxidoreductase [Verrucomicrobia bacterium]|nr:SDR family NAD(P)-dependent oxidoreductase [Verrucomicrobiota bacterium]